MRLSTGIVKLSTFAIDNLQNGQGNDDTTVYPGVIGGVFAVMATSLLIEWQRFSFLPGKSNDG